MPVITVSREIGAGGAYFSLKLAEAIGGTCVDKEIIHWLAEKMNKNQEDVKPFDPETYDRLTVFFQEALASVAKGGLVFSQFGIGPFDWTSMDLFPPFPHQEFGQDEYIAILKQVMQELAQKENVVILGRGGQMILKDHPKAFNVRLVADMPHRLTRVQEEQKIDPDKAKELIQQRDESARKFLEDFFDVDWADGHLYHLTLNTSRIPLDTCVDLVLKTIQKNT